MARASLSVLCAAIVTASLSSGCLNPNRPPHEGMARIWRGYGEMKPHRAIAIAGDPEGLWVGAAAGGAHSRIEAEQAVLGECRRKRAQRRMQAPCRLYAVGDEIVWGSP